MSAAGRRCFLLQVLPARLLLLAASQKMNKQMHTTNPHGKRCQSAEDIGSVQSDAGTQRCWTGLECWE